MIGISGKQYSGKDVLADLLIQAFPQFSKIPLARAIKEAYTRQHGLTLDELEAQKSEHRPGLIALGDWGRAQDPQYWFKQVIAIPGPKIIPDVRLQREHQLLREQGAFLIRLNANRAIRSQRGTLVSEHDLTECDLDNVTDWDAVLTNNSSITDLKQQLVSLVIHIKRWLN